MIIWKGLGFLGALIPFILILLMNWLLGPASLGWAFLTSAVPVWLLGRYFYKRPVEMMVDPKTNQNVSIKPEHDLFWVELDYWAIIFAIFGIAMVLPESIGNIALQIAKILIPFIFFGRLGFGLYQKYIKKDNTAITNLQNQPGSNANPQNEKEDKLSRFSTEKKNKRTFGTSQAKEKTIDNNKGLPASELKKKAYYAQMRKDRAAPKKFTASTHSNYFPGSSKMPFIPKEAILNKETTTEEE